MSLRIKAWVGRDGSKKYIEPIERLAKAEKDKERTHNNEHIVDLAKMMTRPPPLRIVQNQLQIQWRKSIVLASPFHCCTLVA
jgi:hypothetical protein